MDRLPKSSVYPSFSAALSRVSAQCLKLQNAEKVAGPSTQLPKSSVYPSFAAARPRVWADHVQPFSRA